MQIITSTSPSSRLLKATCNTPYYSFLLYARAALSWTEKQNKNNSLRNDKLKVNRTPETEEQRKERLEDKPGKRWSRIKLQEEKKRSSEAEDCGKQCLATLKRLKRGDENELERKLRLEKVIASKQLRLAVQWKKKDEQDWRMMQLPNGSSGPWRWESKTGEDGCYHTAHVGHGEEEERAAKKRMDLIWI